eukprot:symbB.v1.2.013828.t1/scaffold990.1/size146246/10
MEPGFLHPTRYMYHDTPTVLVCIWCVGLFCATLTVAVTVYNVRRHYESAREQGLGHHEMLPSFGARADRIMQLLLVPAVGAVTSTAQMFLPGAAPILSFLRVCQFSMAMRDLIEFLFLLNGSQQHIVENLPKEKTYLFSKFPLCCICIAERPRLGHLRFFVAGIRQFSFLLPLFGVVDVYIDNQEDMPGFATWKKVCEIIISLSTFIGMWSFKCLLPLMTKSIRAEDMDPERLASMERFVLLQMAAMKLLGFLMPRVVTHNLYSDTPGGWVMPMKFYVTIITGFMLTAVQLMLALLGACAYNADETLYPELDEASDVPPDALALLDMNGIDVTRWKRLQHLHYDDA